MNASHHGAPRWRFTLMEVICALAITALLMVTVSGVLRLTVRGMQRSRQTLRRARLGYGVARILRWDVEALVPIPDEQLPPVVVPPEFPTDGGTVLELTTLSALPHSDAPPDVQRVRYLLRPRDEEAEGYELLRQQTPYEPGSSPDWRHAAEQRLVDEVAFVLVDCYDGSEWRRQWSLNKPPIAVRMELALHPEADPPHPTCIAMPLADRTVDPRPKLPDEAVQE